ncbi:MAG: nucleotidyltransferase family protein [Pirellulales bacterium]|nr:nucleotidyltransferase family protein [Pirellulales bacterium]
MFETIAQHQAELRRLGVRRLQLFGSAVRNETNGASDLDFIVQLEENSFGAYMDVKFFLEDLFHCPVDLVLPDTIKPQLRDHILQEATDAPGF